MLIKLGKVNEVTCDKNDDEIKNVKLEIEVTTDEYIFKKTGLFSSKEIIRIKKKDVTSITNENLHPRSMATHKKYGTYNMDLEGTKSWYLNNNYLTIMKKNKSLVEIYFDNKSSSDVDGIITQLK